jgi:hypothetical protein
MKLLITGSPEITDIKFVTDYCVNVASKLQFLFDVRTPDVEIVSAHENKGVMWIVEDWARTSKLRLKVFEVNWKDMLTQPVVIGSNSYGLYNKQAGANRNVLAVEYTNCSEVIGCLAFDDGKFKPTKDIVRLCKKAFVPTWQINCKDMTDIKIKIWNGEDDYAL